MNAAENDRPGRQPSKRFRLWDAGGARLAAGTGVVIDGRADDRIERQDAEAFEEMGRACGSVGWEFRRVGAVDPVLVANGARRRVLGLPQTAGPCPHTPRPSPG
jgi:hypothetical protein